MFNRLGLVAIGVLLVALFAALPMGLMAGRAIQGRGGQAAPAGGVCDRACLNGIADAYLAALVAHAPSKAAMSPAAKFVENSKLIPVGEGVLWKYTTGVSPTFKIPIADPGAGQIGMIVMLKESGTAPGAPALGGAPAPATVGTPPDRDIELALRLKIVNRQITEAEHIFATINGAAALANMQTPRPSLLATVPATERLPRELMLLIGNSYYDSIVQNDGNAAPYGDDCERHENGMLTSGGPGTGNRPSAPREGGGLVRHACKEGMTNRWLSYITSIDLRRVSIADEERGLVFGLTMFRQPMEEKTLTLLNPDGTTTPRPMNSAPFDFDSAHIFKIQGGKLHDIEALGVSLPLFSKNGWTDFIR